MPRLPTDTCGKIYRDFDTYAIESSVRDQIVSWCVRDLGLTAEEEKSAAEPSRSENLVYDSNTYGSFSDWGVFDTSRKFHQYIQLVKTSSDDVPGEIPTVELRAQHTELVGMNKKLNIRQGAIEVECLALESSAKALNMYVCAIPMRAPFDRLIEVGATTVSEPENATSPYRVRAFVQHHHIGDGKWHKLRLAFDFTDVPDAAYAICALRINEGCPRPGPAILRVRNVRVTTSQTERSILAVPTWA